MRKLSGYFLSTLIVATVISCSESLDPTPFEYSQIFSGRVSKTWSLRSIAFRNTGDDDWKLTEACWSDDAYIFYRDAERKFEFKSGSTKCDPQESKVTITDTWSFSNANATLSFIIPILSDNALPFTVVDVDNNDLTVEIFFNDAGSQSYQMKFVLKDEK